MRQLIWVGITSVAGILAGAVPSCHAQEVNPDHFTATGIDGVNAKKAEKRAAKAKAKPADMVSRQTNLQVGPTSKTREAEFHRQEVVLTSAKKRNEKSKGVPKKQ